MPLLKSDDGVPIPWRTSQRQPGSRREPLSDHLPEVCVPVRRTRLHLETIMEYTICIFMLAAIAFTAGFVAGRYWGHLDRSDLEKRIHGLTNAQVLLRSELAHRGLDIVQVPARAATIQIERRQK